MFTSCSVLRRMRNVSDKFVEKIKTHIQCSIIFFGNRDAYEIMWESVLQTDRPQITILCMSFACWMFKATDTISEYVIINAIPRQQCLTNAPQYYILRTLSVLFDVWSLFRYMFQLLYIYIYTQNANFLLHLIVYIPISAYCILRCGKVFSGSWLWKFSSSRFLLNISTFLPD